jgi:hypothetical protein
MRLSINDPGSVANNTRSAYSWLQWVLFVMGLVFVIAQLVLSWRKPILDQYAFRQTQTAISVYWMIKGDAWLAYVTPVVGAPWALPFEFPLYQWLVAALDEVLPFLTLDQAGRVISELFFLACIWPLWRIATHCSEHRALFRVCVCLLLFSPLYAFWSRSFMMESTVLYFSILFVAATIDYLKKPSVFGFSEMTLAGMLAACIKITTFAGFSFAAALYVLCSMYVRRKTLLQTKQLLIFVPIAASIVLSILALLAWLKFSDGLKLENWFGQSLTSEGLRYWNFGTLVQRESIDIYRIILKRAPNEALGSWLIPMVFSVVFFFNLSKLQLSTYFALLLLYAAPFMIFTNLHIIHNYYQYANSIFLVLAIGYGISMVMLRKPVFGMMLFVCAVSFEVFGYAKYFYADMMQPNREIQLLLAEHVRAHVDPDQVVVGFGLTWSSEVPYYAERRFLLVPDTSSPGMLARLASDVSKYTGDRQVGAVIVCPNSLQNDNSTKASYDLLSAVLIKGKKPKVVGYCEVYE